MRTPSAELEKLVNRNVDIGVGIASKHCDPMQFLLQGKTMVYNAVYKNKPHFFYGTISN